MCESVIKIAFRGLAREFESIETSLEFAWFIGENWVLKSIIMDIFQTKRKKMSKDKVLELNIAISRKILEYDFWQEKWLKVKKNLKIYHVSYSELSVSYHNWGEMGYVFFPFTMQHFSSVVLCHNYTVTITILSSDQIEFKPLLLCYVIL